MTALALATIEADLTLPALVERAAASLAGAKSAAEILEAREMAGLVIDAAKRAVRMAKAREAADELIAAAYRAEADAHEIQAKAKRRLADEYDAAQERGEVATRADGPKVRDLVPGENKIATAADLGISRKDIHEGRLLNAAEERDPGVVRRALDECVAAGNEPTREAVKRAARAAVDGASSAEPARNAPARGAAAICDRVKECVVTLAGLPPAAEVARYFANADSGVIVGEKLNQAATWLADFRAAWEANNA